MSPADPCAGLRQRIAERLYTATEFPATGVPWAVAHESRRQKYDALASEIVDAHILPLVEALEAGLFALNEERVRWGRDGDCWDACAGVDHDPDCEGTRIARDGMVAALAAARAPRKETRDGE